MVSAVTHNVHGIQVTVGVYEKPDQAGKVVLHSEVDRSDALLQKRHPINHLPQPRSAHWRWGEVNLAIVVSRTILGDLRPGQPQCLELISREGGSLMPG